MKSKSPNRIMRVAAFTGGVDGNNPEFIAEHTKHKSPPSRAAWIEIRSLSGSQSLQTVAAFTGGVDGNIKSFLHSPNRKVAAFTGGVDGNAFGSSPSATGCSRRRLHGRRGLKYFFAPSGFGFSLSPPSRAAWIEIVTHGLRNPPPESPPSRAAWIEMHGVSARGGCYAVAAFTGGVDGNIVKICRNAISDSVAAFTGGVDGNHFCFYGFGGTSVAAFTGGVDGNAVECAGTLPAVWSPPSRAAWIEIACACGCGRAADVAAFTGGVDGNTVLCEPVYHGICRRLHGRRGLKFALLLCCCRRLPSRRLHGRRGLKLYKNRISGHALGRRLHGRRGLKFALLLCCCRRLPVAAFTGGVDGNTGQQQYVYQLGVAAFTGGVDGNPLYSAQRG